MAKVRLAVTARCLGCDWAAEGEKADGAAGRHTVKTQHATAVVAVPVKAGAP